MAAPGPNQALPLREEIMKSAARYFLLAVGHDLRLIQDYLGHCDPRHTVHYTRTAGRRFEGLWSR